MELRVIKYHYKVLLLLITANYTQADVRKLLNLKKQNINRVFRDLEKLGLIEVKETKGANKYYRLVDVKRLKLNIVGQIKII